MLRRMVNIGLLGVTLALVFSVLMIAAYALPSTRIRSHLPSSIDQLASEGEPYRPFFGLWGFSTFNYVDALMLNEALGPARQSPIRDAFANEMLTQTSWPGSDTLGDLRAAVQGRGSPFAYARYWHGYQVVLRPLLILFDYRAIRWLNAVVFFLLLAAVSLALRYRLGLKTMLAFLFALIAVNVAVVPMSMVYSGVFYVALGGVLVATLNMNRENGVHLDLEIFFILGALTAFVDLLSTPLVTLGIPLTVLLIGRIQSSREFSNKSLWWHTAKMSIVWFCGYAGTWAAKWLLSTLVLGYNVIEDGLASVMIRSYGAAPGVTTGWASNLAHQLLGLLPILGWHKDPPSWDVIAAACTVPMLVLVLITAMLAKHKRADGRGVRVLGLLLVGALPFAWYLVLYNHSSIHYFMTYRLLSISVFAAGYSVLYLFEPYYLATLKSRLEGRLRGD
ncbi:MAG: hypothetical protein WCJ13_08145 [Coriobacteriia bacterium]